MHLRGADQYKSGEGDFVKRGFLNFQDKFVLLRLRPLATLSPLGEHWNMRFFPKQYRVSILFT